MAILKTPPFILQAESYIIEEIVLRELRFLLPGGDGSMGDYRVPAVKATVRILRELHAQDGRPVGATALARRLGMNVSTCFNILKTLHEEAFVDFDPASRTYRLGRDLVKLASRAGTVTDFIGRSLPLMRRLTGEVGLTCIATILLPDDYVLVVDAIQPVTAPLALTASVGQRFHPLAPVVSKAFWAWSPPSEVDALIRRHGGLPGFTAESVADRDAWHRELARTKERGYCCSLQEFYEWANAVGSPVFNALGQVAFVLVVLGAVSDFPRQEASEMGRRLNEVTREITLLIGGVAPGVEVHPSANSGSA